MPDPVFSLSSARTVVPWSLFIHCQTGSGVEVMLSSQLEHSNPHFGNNIEKIQRQMANIIRYWILMQLKLIQAFDRYSLCETFLLSVSSFLSLEVGCNEILSDDNMKYIQFVFRVDGLPTKFCNRSNHFKCAVVLLLFAAITRLGSFNLTSIDMNQYRYRLGDYNNYNHVSSLTSSSSSNKKKEKQPTSSSFYYSEQDLDYSLWLIDQRNRSVHHLPYLPDNENNQDGKEQKSVIVSEIYYRAMQGLGHQLLRLSSAYHLASVYKIPKIQITHNPYCGGTIYTIYDYLIGEGPVFVDIPPGQGNNVFLPNNRTFLDSLLLDGHPQKGWPKLRPLTNLRTTITGDNDNNREGKVLFLNNEVMAYGHPSGLWSHRQVIHELLANNFYNKQITDYQLYHQLMTLFETNHKQEISNIVNQTLFEHHTVFGLHIRSKFTKFVVGRCFVG